jgi:hypothetical protein
VNRHVHHHDTKEAILVRNTSRAPWQHASCCVDSEGHGSSVQATGTLGQVHFDLLVGITLDVGGLSRMDNKVSTSSEPEWFCHRSGGRAC